MAGRVVRTQWDKRMVQFLVLHETDYRALIAQARDTTEKIAGAQKPATRRLASGVVPELDECFAALDLR